MSELNKAIEAQRAAELALENAKQETRQIALRQLHEAQEACRMVGVAVTTKRVDGRQSPETRARLSGIHKNIWNTMSAERRAERLAKMALARWNRSQVAQ